jgi:predicted nucleic acid-binding protein
LRSVLLDTGPIVAYLDRSESAHSWARATLQETEGNLVTTSAVITEVMHFLSPVPNGPSAVSELIDQGPVQVFDFCGAPDLRRAVGRMVRYADTPMDFADATLVLLAEAVGSGEILTLDRRGFRTYRWGRNRAFSLLGT